MFKLPTGYDCIVPVVAGSETQVYAYDARRRDTYDLINFEWVKTRHITYNANQDLSSYDCLSNDILVPNSIRVSFILPATLFILAFFTIIIKIFMGVRR